MDELFILGLYVLGLLFALVGMVGIVVLHRDQVAHRLALMEVRGVLSRIDAAEAATVTVEQQLIALMSVAPDPVMTFNGKTGQVTYANTAAYDLFGYGSELLDLTIEDLMPERFRLRHQAHRARFMATTPRSRPMGPFLKIYALTRSGEEVRVHIGLNNYGTNSVVAWIKQVPDIGTPGLGELT